MKTFLYILTGMILVPIIITLLIFGFILLMSSGIGITVSEETMSLIYWITLIIGGGIIGWRIRR